MSNYRLQFLGGGDRVHCWCTGLEFLSAVNGVIGQVECHIGHIARLSSPCWGSEEIPGWEQRDGGRSTWPKWMCISNAVHARNIWSKQREHRQKEESQWESRPALCKCFPGSESGPFFCSLLHSQPKLSTSLYKFSVVLLKYARCDDEMHEWNAVLTVRCTVCDAACDRIFMHSCISVLIAAVPLLDNQNYAAHSWRPSRTNKNLATLSHEEAVQGCEKWKSIDDWHLCSFSVSSFFSLWMDLSVHQYM